MIKILVKKPKILLKSIGFNNLVKFCFTIFFTFTIVSCTKRHKIITPFFSFINASSGNTSFKILDNSVDSHNGIILLNSDTITFEYGRGIFKKPEEKTIIPIEQKKYWDSVGLSKEIIFSSQAKDDYDLRSFETHYYVKDTISNKDAIWIFPKKFKHGITGVYFYNVNKNNNLSLYAHNLSSAKIDEFIELIKTIRFNK